MARSCAWHIESGPVADLTHECVLVLDEAQHLDDDELEAIRSAVSSAPLGNPQVIYTGTP